MTFTPDTRQRFRNLALAGVALALALPLVAQDGPASKIEKARDALRRDDGIAAEILLKQALAEGVARVEVAALLGEAELLQGDNYDAREWLGPGEFVGRDAIRGFHLLGQLEMQEGNLVEAGQAFDKALERGPGTSSLWVDISRMRYIGGEQHQAFQASNRALELNPKDPRAAQLRGQLARDAEGLLAGLAWFEQGLEHNPDDLGLLGEMAATLGELGRAKEMLATTRRMIELDGRNSRAFFLQAVLAARAGKDNLARRLMWRLDEDAEKEPAVELLAAVLDIRSGNTALAVEKLDELARGQPDNRTVQRLYGQALLDNGDAAEIIARFGAQANRMDADAFVLTLVGRAHEQRGDRDLAGPYLDRASHLSGDRLATIAPSAAGDLALYRYGDESGRSDAMVARVRALIAQGQAAEAAQLAADLAEQFQGSADIEVLAGDAALNAGKVSAALEFYSNAANVRTNFPLLRRQVRALGLIGRERDARVLASRYLLQHPQDGEAAALLARLWVRQGEMAKAALLLSHARACGTGNSDPVLLADLAMARLAIGDVEGAHEPAERAYAIQPMNRRMVLVMAEVLHARDGETDEVRALLAKADNLHPVPGNQS